MSHCVLYSLEFALSLANYIYLSILLKASPGQRDAGLFLYLIKETHSGERSVKYQGSSVSDTLASGRGLEGDVAEGLVGQGAPTSTWHGCGQDVGKPTAGDLVSGLG